MHYQQTFSLGAQTMRGFMSFATLLVTPSTTATFMTLRFYQISEEQFVYLNDYAQLPKLSAFMLIRRVKEKAFFAISRVLL